METREASMAVRDGKKETFKKNKRRDCEYRRKKKMHEMRQGSAQVGVY